MKRLHLFILILLFFKVSIFSQWTYKSGESDFDGSFKSALATGVGGEFPYNNPYLIVNKWDDGDINLYLKDVGYSGCDNKVVLFKFNDDSKIYKTKNVSDNNNKDAWFIQSMQEIDKIELLKKFIKHNSVSIRIKSNCIVSDYKFSLRGSTKALNFVLGSDYLKNHISEKKKEKTRLALKKESQKKSLNINSTDTNTKRKYNNDDFYINKTDIKVYDNISDVDHKFILPSNSIIVIDSDYYDKLYYKTKFISELSEIKLYILKKDIEKML